MRLDLDQQRPGAPGVSFNLTSRGGAIFADITGANVGRRLAIVLDNRVQSAPNIRERIPARPRLHHGLLHRGGGAEPLHRAPLRRAPGAGEHHRGAERSAPSLGQDSIQHGLMAGAIGAGAVCSSC